jgi:hypothetical protein
MRVELVSLLATHCIAHPSRITHAGWHGDAFFLGVQGFPWWRERPSTPLTEEQITFTFSNLGPGIIRTDEFDFADDEALEDFDITAVAEVPWAMARDFSVYCSGPIRDPLALYVRLDDYLSSKGAFMSARDFLNQSAQIETFVDMARSSTFLVARGPECIRALVCDELKAQGTPHKVLDTIASVEAKYLVALGGSQFLCHRAEAEFDD